MNTLESRLQALGYALDRRQKDCFNRVRRYRTSPGFGRASGPINYFDSRAQLDKWIGQVEQIREWQKG